MAPAVKDPAADATRQAQRAHVAANAQPIDQGVLARLKAGVRYFLTGKPPDQFFGPSQPLAPQAQEQAQGRQFDYQTAINTVWTPRSQEAISFNQLRTLADSCDLVRLAIETRKDQMCKLAWTIRPKDPDAQADDRCKAVQDFLASPDREHLWDSWFRMLLEDLLVIDAPAVYPRMTRGGDVYSLDLMDGAMFKRVISADGRTPMAPDPAYQQIIKGMPAVDYSRDELLYVPRNPRTHKLYGFSPVEQIIVTVNILLRRQLHKLQYYTDGSAPDLMIQVPENWQPDQIKQMQEYFDALLAGNTAERRKTRFIPGGMAPFDVKEGALKDEYDEWLARVVCYCFSLPPTAFVKMMNRASGQQQADTALEEGLEPLKQWTQGFMNQLIWRWFKLPDVIFDWQQAEEIDQLAQAQIDLIYLEQKVVTPDEVRETLGRDPLTQKQKDELNPAPPPDTEGGPGKPGQAAAPGEGSQASKRLKKNASARLTAIGRPSRGRVRHSARY